MTRPLTYGLLAAAIGLTVSITACDSDIAGERLENLPPETDLAVRDTSLIDNLESGEKLTSTVFVSWTGDDPDGFVESFDLRFYAFGESPAKDELWTNTASNDTLVLLPIPPGERFANVVFEARAIDNDGAADPSPARTVFPIRNAPPTIRFSTFELTPDTTFAIFSFAWVADDPEGPENLDRIDVSLNDSLNFVPVPADVEFVTFVGDVDKNDPGQQSTTARLFFGRSFSTSGIDAPGLLLGQDNTVYIRAVDKTDTTSAISSHTWHVKKSRGDLLYVNDYRKSTFTTVKNFHIGLLRDYLPPGYAIDLWDISIPFVSGSAGDTPRSNLMPTTLDPTLRQALADYRYIYWVATSTTGNIATDNLPFVAGATDLFFEEGGKMMVHSPIALPANPEDIIGNPALLLLPLTGLVSFPDTLRPALRMSLNASITPTGALPGLGVTLPELKSNAFFINTLPYEATGANVVPLADGEYRYVTRVGGRQGPWFGSSTIASISADRRVALFGLPLVNEQSGEQTLIGADGDVNAPIEAVRLMLESLGFPQ